MKKTLMTILAAALISTPIADNCKPKGAIAYDERDVEQGWYCNCKLLHAPHDEVIESCEGKANDIMADAFGIGAYAGIKPLQRKFGKGRVTNIDEQCKSVKYDGMTASELCCYNGNPHVGIYEITSPNFVLRYGIKVGMNRQDVISILEKPNLRCPNMDLYQCEGGGAISQLLIKYENNIVSSIVINNYPD